MKTIFNSIKVAGGRTLVGKLTFVNKNEPVPFSSYFKK